MARKILLADDSVTAQNMGRKILADAGYEVITVNNGSAALKKIAEHHPDLIVLDVYMPGYSGLEVCQRLKDAAETARIPILLTVGKLEPFKPEEAKRVRADAFIVKPFEASELLSALSKLEDKVVHRPEPSKPGRFARATAAIEEGRYDKTMAVEEDDTGWKRRIFFPPKKKEKPAQEEIDTGEIYNPVNKDLRTVIEHKDEHAPAVSKEHPPAAASAESHVNMGALAPEGLPKDVTPEEIAALAAAAAQIKGTVVEGKTPAPVPEMTVTTPTAIDARELEPGEVQAKEEVRAPEAASVPDVTAAAAPVTFAEQKTEEKSEEKIEDKKPEPHSVSTQADAMSAIMGLETQMIAIDRFDSGNGAWSRPTADPTPEPATMAVAATEPATAEPTRWSAVAVAVAADESSTSLEHEMQKAHAAYAAAEGGHVSAAVIAETKPQVPELAGAATGFTEPTVAEVATPIAEIPATSAPEAVQTLALGSEAAAEAMDAVVKAFEAVAAKHEPEQSSISAEATAEIPVPIAPEPPIASVSELPAAADEKIDATEEKLKAVDHSFESQADAKLEEIGKNAEAEIDTRNTEEKIQDKLEEPPVAGINAMSEEQTAAPVAEATASESAPQAPAEAIQETETESSAVVHTPEVVAKVEAPDVTSNNDEVSAEPEPGSRASTTGGADEMTKRESETAAAWASWRKIRATGSPKSADEPTSAEAEEVPQDKAAMAVAVGAESKPEEATSSFDADPEIASIVDSVLADMRPKIVEEIARKLGKKK